MASITQLKMRSPDDLHVHLREGKLLEEVLVHTARCFRRALVMPNLKDAITIGANAQAYAGQIQRHAETLGVEFHPLTTIKLTQETSPDVISSAASHGVCAVKLYPEGVTTNSQNGVRDLYAINIDVFRAMVDHGMVLCVHAEEPGVFSMDRELAYLRHVEKIVAHTKLKVVIEHATTAGTLKFVKEMGTNVAATITVHHLMMTLDDVIDDKGKLNPHNFCKPIAKRPEDRDALMAMAMSGDPQFFLGTDSAPHVRGTKECASGCAGCFTAPIAMELLAGLFDGKGNLPKLEAFTSEFGAKFYGLKPNETTMTLQRQKWTVPDVYGSVVPFKAGEQLEWKVV